MGESPNDKTSTRDDGGPLFPLPDVPWLEVPEGFEARLVASGVKVDAGVVAKVGGYLAHLLAMNARMNLTAIEDPAEAWERHAFDALTLVPLLADVAPNAQLVDVGSGGGVPGIPLAVARPDLKITLVEATQKKAAFLEAVATALGLANVSVCAGRAEALVKGPLGGSFDVVTARAVARLEKLLPLTAPFARAGGRLLLVKGQKADEELAEAGRAMRAQRVTHDRTVATPTGRIVVLRKSDR